MSSNEHFIDFFFLFQIIRTFILISFILIFATIGEASVTWQRVVKPSTRAPETQSTAEQTTAISPSKPATKAPITWKRSTIVRRSTDVAENRAHAEELDDLNNASSEKDEEIEGKQFIKKKNKASKI